MTLMVQTFCSWEVVEMLRILICIELAVGSYTSSKFVRKSGSADDRMGLPCTLCIFH